MVNILSKYAPGLALLLIIGIFAKVVAAYIPLLSHLIVAVAIGVIITNSVSVPPKFRPGSDRYKLILEIGIVLMGATLTFDSIIEVGPTVLLLVIVVVTATGTVIELVSRSLFNHDDKLGSLLAAGASICGVSAVVAVAGGIRAEEKHIAYAVGVILVFDAITLFTYPFIAEFLMLSDTVFGIWAGLTMFSTGPVVAAGFEYSPESGQLATITKLTRNLLISLVVLIYSTFYIPRTVSESAGASQVSLSNRLGVLWEKFPKFLFGFVLVMLIANSGVLTGPQIQSVENAYQWAFLLAFSGLGLQIQFDEMLQAGKSPLIIVALSFVLVSTSTLVMLLYIFP